MEKSQTEQEKESSLEWFSLTLSKKQALYFYVFSIIAVLSFIGALAGMFSSIIRSFLEDYNFPFYSIISIIIPSVVFILALYTIKKTKPILSKGILEREGFRTKWFGILIGKNHAPMLLLLALIGIFYHSLMVTFQMIYAFPFSGDLGIQYMLKRFLYSMLSSTGSILFLIASIYTIKKAREFAVGEKDNTLWFQLELGPNTRLVIFICSIIGILFFLYFILISSTGLIDSFIYWISHRELPSYRISSLISYFAIIGISILGVSMSFYSFFRIRKMKKNS